MLIAVYGLVSIVVSIILKKAIGPRLIVQCFELESIRTGGRHSQMGVHGSFVGRGMHPLGRLI